MARSIFHLFDDKHRDSVTRTADLTFTPLTSFVRQALETRAPDRREVGVHVRHEFE